MLNQGASSLQSQFGSQDVSQTDTPNRKELNAEKLSFQSSLSLENFDSLNVEINNITIDELFDQYEKSGFLYPEKRKRLGGYLGLIQENWKKALQSKDDIIQIFTYREAEKNLFSAVSLWRIYEHGMLAEHLISNGSPIGTRQVLLGAKVHSIGEPEINSGHLYYSKQNKYAFRLYGHINSSINSHNLFEETFSFFTPSKQTLPVNNKENFSFIRVQDSHSAKELITAFLGKAFCASEEFDGNDFELKNLNETYKKAGLYRERQLWAVTEKSKDTAIGVLIFNNSSIGINFSFLENSCVFIPREDLDQSVLIKLIPETLSMINELYKNFVPDFVPILTNEACGKILSDMGYLKVREYTKIAWLRGGFIGWYKHIENVFKKLTPSLIRKELLYA